MQALIQKPYMPPFDYDMAELMKKRVVALMPYEAVRYSILDVTDLLVVPSDKILEADKRGYFYPVVKDHPYYIMSRPTYSYYPGEAASIAKLVRWMASQGIQSGVYELVEGRTIRVKFLD